MSEMRKLWTDPDFLDRIEKMPAKQAGAAPAQDIANEAAAQPAGGTVDLALIKDRLAKLIGPYKEALAQNGPDAQRLRALVGTITTSIGKKQFPEAGEVLDTLEQLLNKPTIAAGYQATEPEGKPKPGTPVLQFEREPASPNPTQPQPQPKPKPPP